LSNTIKISFLTSLRVNVGDEFIREGIRAILDRLPASYYPLYINKHDPVSLYHPEEDEPIIVSDKYWDSDLFIQAGAPVYWQLVQDQWTSLTSEWHTWMWEERILNTERDDHPVFINLGAGSCQPWGEDGKAFLDDPACVRFAESAAEKAMLTSVRDPVASGILSSLALPHLQLACPAFLAAVRHGNIAKNNNLIGINLMPLGAHYDLRTNFNAESWKLTCLKLVNVLRMMGRLVFIAHDEQEKIFAGLFAAPDERIFLSKAWRDYLDIYSVCGLVIANRVHGAVCAAGFGVPSIIIGNDSRATIGDYIGICSFQSGKVKIDEILDTANILIHKWPQEQERLLESRKENLNLYIDNLRPVLEKVQANVLSAKARRVCAIPKVALASVSEIVGESFQGFMKLLNDYAEKNNLRIFTDWSKIWEYPWLWFNGLGSLDWSRQKVLSIGSELSPMPWFLSSLGSSVTIVEHNSQWLSIWENLAKKTNLKVDWCIVADELLPFPAESFDVVTSFSAIEHQRDKHLALQEIARVLKPGGILAMSFDICEPDMGMTFPEWNSSALTMKEFEELVWTNPAFDNKGEKTNWNICDCTEFIKWHLESAPHHNYTVGAAVIRKKL
jgi:polysaccharide pyruvyl transferase WcaK-like protein/SAM-dependent methyltransferase